jgi:nucleoside 2-deoxyribosyltransferase
MKNNQTVDGPDADAKSKKQSAHPFPRVTLEDALKVSTAIKEKNSGNPWPPSEVAKAVGMAAKSSAFYYLTAGARDYGLTEGTRDTATISLTELGREVTYPASPQVALVAKRKAFLQIEIFRKVLAHYKGSQLPEMEYLSNTLEREFKLHKEHHADFRDIFEHNCRYLQIGADTTPELALTVSPNGESNESQTVTLARPKKGEGKLCFVIIPFREREDQHPTGFFQEVLDSLIVPAAKELGFEVRSANRHGSDVIQQTIINDLLNADIVVADLTEHNPNVLFELGVRMAEDKPVALFRAKGTGQIFDVDNMLRVLDYNPNLWASTIKNDLPKIRDHIKATWENRNKGFSYMKLLRGEARQVEEELQLSNRVKEIVVAGN